MKKYFKRCFWKYVRASFEHDKNIKCHRCTGYNYKCSKYMKSQKSDIIGLMIMHKKGRERLFSGGNRGV